MKRYNEGIVTYQKGELLIKPIRIIGFQLRELAGSVPPDHRPLKSGIAGPRAVQPRQIWVDRLTDELWQIRRISAGVSSREFRFTIGLYGGYWEDRTREISWLSLQGGFRVLEDAIHSRRERHRHSRAITRAPK